MTLQVIKQLLDDNTRGLSIGIIVTTILFIIRYCINKIKINNTIRKRVKTAMDEKNVDFHEAKNFIIKEEILNGLRINKNYWYLKDDRLVYQGVRISFYDKEIGITQGEFIGLIESEVIGYDDLYVLKIIKDNSIRQAPISFIDEDTINIYN